MEEKAEGEDGGLFTRENFEEGTGVGTIAIDFYNGELEKEVGMKINRWCVHKMNIYLLFGRENAVTKE